jgi:PEGA domain-containing protein
MKSLGYSCIVASGLLLCGCWANPSLVKVQSDPPGARVSYNGQDLGVTPISAVLACPLMSQHIQFELAEQPTREVPLYKRPIRYYVPWYAIVAAGFFTFSTTWRSEACVPDDFTVVMANGEIRTPSSSAEAEAKAAQEKWIKREQKSEEAGHAP